MGKAAATHTGPSRDGFGALQGGVTAGIAYYEAGSGYEDAQPVLPVGRARGGHVGRGHQHQRAMGILEDGGTRAEARQTAPRRPSSSWCWVKAGRREKMRTEIDLNGLR